MKVGRNVPAFGDLLRVVPQSNRPRDHPNALGTITTPSHFLYSFQNVVLVSGIGRTMREECANLCQRLRDNAAV